MVTDRGLLVVLASCSAIVALGIPEPTMAHAPTELRAETPSAKQQLAGLRERLAKLEAIASELHALAKDPMPKGLPAQDRKTWPGFIEFVSQSAEQLSASTREWTNTLDALETGLADREDPEAAVEEATMSFNMQFLRLQSSMQHESRTFTMISNIMKTKHDTVKNSISNIR
jgi:hypothetical protein